MGNGNAGDGAELDTSSACATGAVMESAKTASTPARHVPEARVRANRFGVGRFGVGLFGVDRVTRSLNMARSMPTHTTKSVHENTRFLRF